mmetsp:Transcript_105365/g.293399  ORF Transcript_105365/g.293399 Transcript_105365/m.293399 type:complete len:82 (-) Transcript_105365:68-313(-)
MRSLRAVQQPAVNESRSRALCSQTLLSNNGGQSSSILVMGGVQMTNMWVSKREPCQVKLGKGQRARDHGAYDLQGLCSCLQ